MGDFYTGAILTFNKFTFVVFQADEYTLSYMEGEPNAHPMSNLEYIKSQLQPPMQAVLEKLKEAFGDAETVSYVTFQEILSKNELEHNDQVLITILRECDENRDGNIKVSKFLSLTA